MLQETHPASVDVVEAAPKKKRARKRTRKHPGVVLLPAKPERRIGHRARFVDPDTGKEKRVTLPSNLTKVEQRVQWAVKKSKDLAKRRHDLEHGAPRATGTTLAAAVARFYGAHPQLRARTLDAYKAATSKFESWAGSAGVRSADDLTRAKLLAFRELVVNERKHMPLKKGKRGTRAATDERRSPHTVNRELRAVRTVLGYLHDADLLPKLAHDDLRRGLKRLPTTSERIEFLRQAECAELLEAALRHDAKTFAATRKEHAAGEPGSTPRYEAVAPLTAFLLLTGMRYGEAVDLEWSQVDLGALGHDGHEAGEVHLYGAGVKTGKARTIDLAVAPSLRLLLALLRKNSDGKGKVFAVTRGHADAAAKRMRAEFGAPASFSWQGLRRTCGCFLTNAHGIFGAASAYRSAKQLGHSVAVAERHYIDVVKGIPRDARTLESAIGLVDVLSRLLAKQ